MNIIKKFQELKIRDQIINTISQSEDSSHTPKLVLKDIANLFNASYVMLFNYSHEKSLYYLLEQNFDLCENSFCTSLNDEITNLFEEVHNSKQHSFSQNKITLSEKEIKGYAIYPIIEGDYIGVIALFNFGSKIDIKLLWDSLSFVSRFLIYFIQQKSLKRILNKQDETMSLIYSISEAVLSTHDTDFDLEQIATISKNLSSADIVTLYKYNNEKLDFEIPPIKVGQFNELDIISKRGEYHKNSVLFKLKDKFNSVKYFKDTRKEWEALGIYKKENHLPETFIEREGISSTIYLPLYVNLTFLGCIFLSYRNGINFTGDLKRKISTLSNFAALAINNYFIFDTMLNFSNQLKVLFDISKKFSENNNQSISKILRIIYSQTERLMDVKNFYIALIDEDSNEINFKLIYDNGQVIKPENEWAPRRFSNGLSEYLIHTKKPLLLQYSSIEKPIDLWLKEKGIGEIGEKAKSWLGTPLIYQDKVVGVMAIQNYEIENYFDENQKEIIFSIGSQAAIAIKNANSVDQLRRYSKDLDKLILIGKDVLMSPCAEEIFINAMQVGFDLSCADLGAIYYYSNINEKVLILKQTLQKKPIGNAKKLQAKEIINISNIPTKPLILQTNVESLSNWKISEQSRSLLLIPILDYDDEKKEVIKGLMQFESYSNNHFDELHLRIFQKLSILVEIAIIQSKRIEDVKKLNEVISEARKLIVFGSIYGDDIHLANNRLGAAEQIAKNIIDFPNEVDTVNNAKRIVWNIQEALDVVNNSKLSMNPEPENFNICESIESVIEKLNYSKLILIQTKYYIKNPIINGFRKQTEQVFRVIIRNAVGALNGEGTIKILGNEVTINDEQFIQIEITDTGNGIPTYLRDSLFELKKEMRTKRGFGLGLPWTKAFLTMIGGNIDFETEVDKGTRMRVQLPTMISRNRIYLLVYEGRGEL